MHFKVSLKVGDGFFLGAGDSASTGIPEQESQGPVRPACASLSMWPEGTEQKPHCGLFSAMEAVERTASLRKTLKSTCERQHFLLEERDLLMIYFDVSQGIKVDLG